MLVGEKCEPVPLWYFGGTAFPETPGIRLPVCQDIRSAVRRRTA